jgi:hypothetical protein
MRYFLPKSVPPFSRMLLGKRGRGRRTLIAFVPTLLTAYSSIPSCGRPMLAIIRSEACLK